MAQELSPATVASDQRQFNYQVRLDGPFGSGQSVILYATSQMTENRSAAYENYNIVHLPTDLFAYRNTTARTFQISGKVVSRNEGEARVNARNLDLVRSWMLPGFAGTGAPPPILFLSAYRNPGTDRLPVILRTYTWTYPEDVDYIFSSDGETIMPIISQLNLEVVECWSAEEINLKKWKIDIGNDGEMSLGAGSTSISGLTPFTAASNFKGIASSAAQLPAGFTSPSLGTFSGALGAPQFGGGFIPGGPPVAPNSIGAAIGSTLGAVNSARSLINNSVGLIANSRQIIDRTLVNSANAFINGVPIDRIAAQVSNNVAQTANAAAFSALNVAANFGDAFRRTTALIPPLVKD
jgi:hypothetical protein